MSAGLSSWSMDRWAVVVVGNGTPSNQISTGALGKTVGFLQQPQTHPLASEWNMEPCYPAFIAASAAVMFERHGAVCTHIGVSSVAHTYSHNILLAMDYHPHSVPSVTADECHMMSKSHLANCLILKQRQLKLFQTESCPNNLEL